MTLWTPALSTAPMKGLPSILSRAGPGLREDSLNSQESPPTQHQVNIIKSQPFTCRHWLTQQFRRQGPPVTLSPLPSELMNDPTAGEKEKQVGEPPPLLCARLATEPETSRLAASMRLSYPEHAPLRAVSKLPSSGNSSQNPSRSSRGRGHPHSTPHSSREGHRPEVHPLPSGGEGGRGHRRRGEEVVRGDRAAARLHLRYGVRGAAMEGQPGAGGAPGAPGVSAGGGGVWREPGIS